MNTKTLPLLTGVLALQLVLAGGLWWSDRPVSATGQAVATPIDTARVDRVVIEDGTDSITLRRTGDDNGDDNGGDGDWIFEDRPEVALDTDRLTELVASVTSLPPALPVATSERSRAQLDVADDDFQRRVQLFAGEERLLSLFVGTSPGYRKAHVRHEGEDAIVAAPLSVHTLPVDRDDWIDATALALPEVALADVESIKTDAWTLTQHNDTTWQLDRTDGVSTDASDTDTWQTSAETLVNALTSLRVIGLAPDDVTGELDETGDAVVEPEVSHTLRVTLADGEPVEFSFAKLTDDRYRVTRNDHPVAYLVSSATYRQIVTDGIDAVLPKETDVSSDATEYLTTDENLG